MILTQIPTLSKKALADELGISRQSLYYEPIQKQKDAEVLEKITGIMDEHPAYGQRRIATQLQMNRKKVRRIMRQYDLEPEVQRKRRKYSKDSTKKVVTTTNILQRICPIAPDVVWATDFTYMSLNGQFVYMCTVIDVYTRELLAWRVSREHTADFIKKTIMDAVHSRGAPAQYIHADQGSEYTSTQMEQLSTMLQYHSSFSAKGRPWQNGFQESFYSQWKLELSARPKPHTVDELIANIHEQMQYYNFHRIHSALGMPPKQFAKTVMN